MRAPLLCVSKACLLLMHLPWPGGLSVHSAAHSWPFVAYDLLSSWAGSCLIVGFSLFNSFFAHSVDLLAFLPCHYVIPAMVLLGLCLLCFFWACCMLSLLLKYSGLVLSLGLHSCFFGLFNPFHCLRVSLANFFLLGHPRPISFPRASLAHSNSIFPCVFAKSFGLFRPNYYILHLWGLWVFHQPFTHLIHCFEPICPILACFLSHIMLVSLLLSFLGSSRPTCFLWAPFIIF